jgi:hypothetical protein
VISEDGRKFGGDGRSGQIAIRTEDRMDVEMPAEPIGLDSPMNHAADIFSALGNRPGMNLAHVLPTPLNLETFSMRSRLPHSVGASRAMSPTWIQAHI